MKLPLSRKIRLAVQIGFICLAVTICLFTNGCDTPELKPWHTEHLTAEFTLKNAEKVQAFDDYRHLEDRLFTQLEETVYARTGTGPAHTLIRYSGGSAADPHRYQHNWNRSFELSSNTPVGGILLLHGMSDSPYSLRALGQTLNRYGYWVVGLRLPGHGTAPSALKHIVWEDMAAVVRLGMAHLSSKVGQRPVHVIGYSTGAPLALDFALDALEGKNVPPPATLVLISPAIGIHPAAKLAGIKNRLSVIPGLGRLAWLSIQPEFDPYKYNSFATNAGNQVYRLTRSVAGRIATWIKTGPLGNFPPTLVFKSTIDATVSTRAVIDNLLKPLGPHRHELVVFDINRLTAKTTLLVSEPDPLTEQLMTDATLPFYITLITNEHPETMRVQARHKNPFSNKVDNIVALNTSWPFGVISLSHVALPFPADDPLYGRRPPKRVDRLFLGQIALQGERGLLRIPYDSLFRLRYNPFYAYLEERVLQWIKSASS